MGAPVPFIVEPLPDDFSTKGAIPINIIFDELTPNLSDAISAAIAPLASRVEALELKVAELEG